VVIKENKNMIFGENIDGESFVGLDI